MADKAVTFYGYERVWKTDILLFPKQTRLKAMQVFPFEFYGDILFGMNLVEFEYMLIEVALAKNKIAEIPESIEVFLYSICDLSLP